MKRPPPKLVTVLPDGSNLRTGSRFEPAHDTRPLVCQLKLPHRSIAQTDRPSRSIATAPADPHVLPGGSVPQFRTVSYGLGSSLGGVVCFCVATTSPASIIEPTRSKSSSGLARSGLNMAALQDDVTRGTASTRFYRVAG